MRGLICFGDGDGDGDADHDHCVWVCLRRERERQKEMQFSHSRQSVLSFVIFAKYINGLIPRGKNQSEFPKVG